jgi:uncharacterized membrane protein YozB (DUF420 family)
MEHTERDFTVTSSARTEWLVAAGLLLLSTVPVAAGAFRLTQLTVGADITPEKARFFAAPIPVLVHIVGATLYCVLGAFQFVASLRRRRSRWHKAVGRVLIPAGLSAALAGLWMTLFYPRPVGDGDLLAVFRVVFGSGMVASILLGLVAIRRRDVPQHRAWMARAYAIALGAGTQAVIFVPVFLLGRTPDELEKALLMATAWLVNLAVAEWIIRRRPTDAAYAYVRARRSAAA